MNCIEKGFTLPSPILREFIDRYWFWENKEEGSVNLPKIYPGTGIELLFHYKMPFIDFPTSHTLCPRGKGHYKLSNADPIGFISIRFKSWAFPYFSNIPVDEIINRKITANNLWPVTGRIVEEKIKSATSFVERTEVLNMFFENLLTKDIKQSPEIDWAINYIYYNYNDVNINQVINDTNLSPRSFQRKFKRSVGINAKGFQKISRFQTILKNSLLDKTYPSLDSILKAGYYDQAHFNKDFNSLTGYNPTSIITKSNFLAHFYNTSINQ